MADYRIRETGEIITDIRTAFPNVSIPITLKQEDFDILGIDPIFEGSQPTLTRFQSIIRTGPVQDSLGNWVWQYATTDWTVEAVAYATDNQWINVRQTRDNLLLKSDWTQLSDAPLTAEQKSTWAAYRQALRDITTQTDPFNISWPVAP